MNRKVVKSITQSLIKMRKLECWVCPKAMKDRCQVFNTETKEVISSARHSDSVAHPLMYDCTKERLRFLADELKVIQYVRIE